MNASYPPIRAVLFDHDGLLVETEWIFYDLTRQALESEGFGLSPDWWAEEYLGKGRSTTELLLGLGLESHRVDAICQLRNARYLKALKQPIPLCDGVQRVLPWMAAHLPIGLVSGNTRSAIESVQRHSGLMTLFSVVVTWDDHPFSKPDPGLYLLAAKHLGLRPEECIAVEDSRRGMQAALNAGMRCVVIPGRLTRGQDFPEATARLESMEELPTWFWR